MVIIKQYSDSNNTLSAKPSATSSYLRVPTFAVLVLRLSSILCLDSGQATHVGVSSPLIKDYSIPSFPAKKPVSHAVSYISYKIYILNLKP